MLYIIHIYVDYNLYNYYIKKAKKINLIFRNKIIEFAYIYAGNL